MSVSIQKSPNIKKQSTMAALTTSQAPGRKNNKTNT